MDNNLYNVYMIPIYIFIDNAHQSAFEGERIQQALSNHPGLKIVGSSAELLTLLKTQQRAVVILGSSTQQLGSLVLQVKNVLSTTACITLLPLDESNYPEMIPTDCECLPAGFTQFELSARIASAMRLTDLLANIQESAQLDESTHLYNSRYFFKRLNEEISLSRRHLSPVSCTILGISFYQMYMDTYGYQFTIDLIKHLADIVKTHIRQEDMIARIGDNEIGILLPRSSEKGAKTLVNRIVDSISLKPFEKNGQTESLSVYAGIASYPFKDEEQASDADSLVRYARHALHNAQYSDDEEPVVLFSEIRPSV